MLHFLSVPPSKRQAAGPLTENLPNVCLVNELAVLTGSSQRVASRASREPSLHQGTLNRLSSRVVCSDRHLMNERELEKCCWHAAFAVRWEREFRGLRVCKYKS